MTPLRAIFRSLRWLSIVLVLPIPSYAQTTAPTLPTTSAQAQGAASPAVSASAKRIYEQSRQKLLQIRTLIKGQDSQASVGSGFLVNADGYILTNYHVVSQFALSPSRYRLKYAGTDGKEGSLELIDIDVRHDLALLRMTASEAHLRGWLQFRDADKPLTKGERTYSLGNPRDVTFAVVEGNFNGFVERSLDPLIYYAGSINPGMSGGPVVDDDGHVVGMNVSAMIFAEQMSFLVPSAPAQALLARSGRKTAPLPTPAWPTVTQQLMSFQEELTHRFLAQAWRPGGHDLYKLPVPQETFMRCWGGDSGSDVSSLHTESTQCRMDHNLFIRDSLRVGYLDFEITRMDAPKLGPWRFATFFGGHFADTTRGKLSKDRTAPQCQESFVESNGLPLRAVMCLSAYKKLKGLYDLDVKVATRDHETRGVIGQFTANGFSFQNAQKLTQHYLKGFGWKRAP